MKCFVGIDLGSTTTKAIVLDEGGGVLGRGITNSRSNYDVACQVALGEAMLDARFRLFERALAREPDVADRVDALLERLRRAFRLQQHLVLLDELAETVRTHAAAHPESARLEPVLGSVFEGLRRDALELFAPTSHPRSDFFRDIVGAGYMARAQAAAEGGEVAFETLLGLFDRSILAVESRVPNASLHETMESALQAVLDTSELPADLARRLARHVHAVLETSLVTLRTVGTGYGRARLPFPRECIRSEILCHGLGAHAAFPRTRTVLDIGGQDTKAIQVDEHGIVTSFQMNDRCAAGCGRYLGYIADEMNLGLHELGPLAQCAKKPVRISSTCTVFAGAELRDHLATGQRREDILAGLHRAIMLRAMSLLARSGGVAEEFTFTGGVAKNPAAVAALRDLVRDNWGARTINISPDSIYTGALGAALFASRDGAAAPAELVAAGGVP